MLYIGADIHCLAGFKVEHDIGDALSGPVIGVLTATPGRMDGEARVEQIVGALICAALSYHFFENPIRRSKALDRRPWLTGLLGVGLIGLVWLSAWLIQTYWTL